MNANININTPSGAEYVIPASFLIRTSPADLLFDFGDPLDIFDETEPSAAEQELQAALTTASLFINFLERQQAPDKLDSLPASVSAAIDKATLQGAPSCSLAAFAAGVVPSALGAQYDALQDARFKSITPEWLDLVQDWYGHGAQIPHPIDSSWIDSTAVMLVAYGALRKTHSIDEIAGAVAEALFAMLTAKKLD